MQNVSVNKKTQLLLLTAHSCFPFLWVTGPQFPQGNYSSLSLSFSLSAFACSPRAPSAPDSHSPSQSMSSEPQSGDPGAESSQGRGVGGVGGVGDVGSGAEKLTLISAHLSESRSCPTS